MIYMQEHRVQHYTVSRKHQWELLSTKLVLLRTTRSDPKQKIESDLVMSLCVCNCQGILLALPRITPTHCQGSMQVKHLTLHNISLVQNSTLHSLSQPHPCFNAKNQGWNAAQAQKYWRLSQTISVVLGVGGQGDLRIALQKIVGPMWCWGQNLGSSTCQACALTPVLSLQPLHSFENIFPYIQGKEYKGKFWG